MPMKPTQRSNWRRLRFHVYLLFHFLQENRKRLMPMSKLKRAKEEGTLEQIESAFFRISALAFALASALGSGVCTWNAFAFGVDKHLGFLRSHLPPFCMLHFAFCISHFAFCILHFTFCILPFAFCLLHFAFCRWIGNPLLAETGYINETTDVFEADEEADFGISFYEDTEERHQ